MVEAYYGYTTGVNSMNIWRILEHSPNNQREPFVFSDIKPITHPPDLSSWTRENFFNQSMVTVIVSVAEAVKCTAAFGYRYDAVYSSISLSQI